MLTYYLFFLLLLLLSCLDYLAIRGKDLIEIKSKALKSVFFVILFFVGFRYKLASDWKSYELMLNQIEPFSEVLFSYCPNFEGLNIEIGFKLYLSLLKQLGLNLEFLTFSVSCFNLISFYYFLKWLNLKRIFTYIFVYLSIVMIVEFDIMRQSLALYIFLYAIPYIGISLKRYLLIIIIASCFHITAILLLPLYFMKKMPISKSSFLAIGFLYIVTLFIPLPLSKVLEAISFFSGSLSFERFSYFIDLYTKPTGITVTACFNLLLLLMAFIMNYRIKEYSATYQLLYKFYLLYILVYIIFGGVKMATDRIVYYFYFAFAFVFVSSIDLNYSHKNKYLLMFICLMYPFLRLNSIFSNEAAKIGLTPYRTFFYIPISDEEIYNRWDKMQLEAEE
ncbi:EpsG family protein [uncultured Bacteroides sp.]|uniref:EpsG family protein n=1 Tax=uncultured Bacteroides sp. TaxID=162156 RepID=UPI00280BBB55|nr:EpsG family protein [uncultured Bacteroides sp.]